MGGSALGLDLQVAKAVGERGFEPLLEQAAEDANDEPVVGLLASDERVAATSLEHVNVNRLDAERRAGPGEHARAIHTLERRRDRSRPSFPAKVRSLGEAPAHRGRSDLGVPGRPGLDSREDVPDDLRRGGDLGFAHANHRRLSVDRVVVRFRLVLDDAGLQCNLLSSCGIEITLAAAAGRHKAADRSIGGRVSGVWPLGKRLRNGGRAAPRARDGSRFPSRGGRACRRSSRRTSRRLEA